MTRNLRYQPWYVRNPEDGIEECSSAKEAKSTAEGIIQSCTEDGHWPAEIECLQWGRLVAHEAAELEPGPERNGEPTYSVKLVRAGDLYVPASKLRVSREQWSGASTVTGAPIVIVHLPGRGSQACTRATERVMAEMGADGIEALARWLYEPDDPRAWQGRPLRVWMWRPVGSSWFPLESCVGECARDRVDALEAAMSALCAAPVGDAPPDPTYWQGRGWYPGIGPWDAEIWDPDRQEWCLHGFCREPVWPWWTNLPRALRTLCAPPSLEVRLRREVRRMDELAATVRSGQGDHAANVEHSVRYEFASAVMARVLREHEAAKENA